MAVVTIEFTNGKKYISKPITVGLEKRLARFTRDTGNMAVKAAEIQDKANELAAQTETSDSKAMAQVAMDEFNAVMASLESTLDVRNQIIVQAFGEQFTLDDLENYCPREEAARVINELQGLAKGIIEKNG